MDLSNFGVGIKKEKEEIKSNSSKANDIKDKLDLKIEEINDSRFDLDFNELKDDHRIKEVERFLPWFIKYQLNSFDDLIITPEIKKIVDFIENKPKGKGLLLIGRAGSGKTTTLNLIGKKYDLEIFEINASDSRNKKSIEETLGDVIKQKSIFKKDKLIIVDEVDGVSGTKDRGGIAQIIKYLKTSNKFIVFAANDGESDKIKSLKKVCITIDFENHSKDLLFEIGKRIFNNEKIKFNERELKDFIEERSTIDIRGFINDLQVSVIDNKFKPSSELELRDYKKKINFILEKIYYSYPEDSLKLIINSDINLDDLLLYLEENTPRVYLGRDLILAFNELSKADVFRGRIRKWQYWRFLVYINFYLTFGVSNSKNSNPKRIKDFKRNERILKKWIYSNKYNSIRSRTQVEKKNGLDLKFIEKLAKYYGTSAKRCRSNDLFYFIISYKNDLNFQKEMDDLLDIDESIKKVLLNIEN